MTVAKSNRAMKVGKNEGAILPCCKRDLRELGPVLDVYCSLKFGNWVSWDVINALCLLLFCFPVLLSIHHAQHLSFKLLRFDFFYQSDLDDCMFIQASMPLFLFFPLPRGYPSYTSACRFADSSSSHQHFFYVPRKTGGVIVSFALRFSFFSFSSSSNAKNALKLRTGIRLGVCILQGTIPRYWHTQRLLEPRSCAESLEVSSLA